MIKLSDIKDILKEDHNIRTLHTGRDYSMLHKKICKHIGICKIDGNGNIVELQREFFCQGWIFKDWEAFWNCPDTPCYVPELHDIAYTKNDFMALCNNQEEIAEKLFYEVDWQSPATLMNEWEAAGEIGTCKKCGKLLTVYDIEICPFCGADLPDE